MGPTKPPNKAQKARLDKLATMMCPCCSKVGWVNFGVEIHHMLSGGKRMGHWFTIPLCSGHHRGKWSPALGLAPEERVSIADGSKAFSEVYGTEREIWERIQRKNGWDATWPASKVLERRQA